MQTSSAPRLGEWLTEREWLAAAEVEEALAEQHRRGGRLGDILLARGKIGYLRLYQAMAEREAMPFADLLRDPPDAALCNAESLDEYIAHGAIPWKKEGDVLLIAVSNPQDSLLEIWLHRNYGNNWRCVMTSPHDIRIAVARLFEARLTLESCERFHLTQPHASAKHLLFPKQQRGFLLLGAFLMVALCCATAHSLVALVVLFQVLYSATMLFKAIVYYLGKRAARMPKMRPVSIPDGDLPVYTVLVPLFREKESLRRLIASLYALDYPPSKLDIKLLCEADDRETIEAVKALQPAYHMQIVIVPPSFPRTKPKACNYGMRFARGEYITIYDAEDRPEPQQLKKAVAAFRALPDDVVCLQARLRYYNSHENLLTRLFELEYRILFEALLPGLESLSVPLPLGGTSNHFSVARLKALGMWDPYNVTEDADLGVRLSAKGFRTLMLDSETKEEAPLRISAWLRQRSRWVKGYMQTWLVHMREPLALYKRIGMLPFLGVQFFIGISCVGFLTAPIIFALSLLLAWGDYAHASELAPAWLLPLSWVNLASFVILHWLQALPMRAAKDENPQGFYRAVLMFPAYWILHSIASYKALWQLVRKPHFWEKTSHGVSRFSV